MKTLIELPTLKTTRLCLRPLTISDAPAIYAYASNPEVSKFTLWERHSSIKDSETFIIEYAHASYKKGEPEPLAITMLSDDKAILGTVGCFWVSKQNKCMELAYALGQDHWGKGIATEAGIAVLNFVFQSFEVERIQCRCKIENKASAQVMRRLGFKTEGVIRSEVWHRDRFWDMHYTSILKHEWPQILQEHQTV